MPRLKASIIYLKAITELLVMILHARLIIVMGVTIDYCQIACPFISGSMMVWWVYLYSRDKKPESDLPKDQDP